MPNIRETRTVERGREGFIDEERVIELDVAPDGAEIVSVDPYDWRPVEN